MQRLAEKRKAVSHEARRNILIESGHRCAVCGVALTLDRAHIVALRKSGDRGEANLICLCANCHQRADIEGWGEGVLEKYKLNPWVLRSNSAEELGGDLEKLKKQVDDLQTAAAVSGKELRPIIDGLVAGMAETVDSASRAGERLRAEVLLPPAEDMAVRLVPSDSLDRLEEYRSDENKAYLFVGIFLGAVLGILSNWVTASAFEITRVSGSFMMLFVVLAALAGAQARQAADRSRRVRSRLLGPPVRSGTEGGRQIETNRKADAEHDAQVDG